MLTDTVLYEIWLEQQGKRQYRFIAILVNGTENYRVPVTQLTFLTEGGIATDMKGAMPVFCEPLPSFATPEQALAEAKVVFDKYLN